MLSLLLAIFPKCNAFQSTTIFRLPTPRKPPKSITAARTEPPRSTMTSTILPISSSAALRTSRPSTPWASAARMMVTEAGGTASLDGTAGAPVGGGGPPPLWGGGRGGGGWGGGAPPRLGQLFVPGPQGFWGRGPKKRI